MNDVLGAVIPDMIGTAGSAIGVIVPYLLIGITFVIVGLVIRALMGGGGK